MLKDALELQHVVETLEYHYGKHHNTYVVKVKWLGFPWILIRK